MKKLLALAAVALGAVAVAIAGAGCDLSPYAAKVDGTTISQSQLNDQLAAIRQNATFMAGLQSQGRVNGAGAGTFDSQFVASVLGGQVTVTLVGDELSRRGVHISGDDLSLARQDVIGSFASQAGSNQAGLALFSSFPPWYQDELVRDSAELTALEASAAGIDITPAAVRRYYLAHQADFAEVCVSHIQVATLADAQRLQGELAAGANFAALARSQSIANDAPSGGVLGCVPARDLPSSVAPAIGDLGTGQVSAPVQIQNQWHLLQVTRRSTQALSDVAAEVRQQLLSQQSGQVNRLLLDLQSRADVTVNPVYGRYVPTAGAGGILPPVPPRPSLLDLPGSAQATATAPSTGH